MLPEQQQRILGYFIEEAKDHLNTIEQGLLSLQNTLKDPEMVNEVFRAAHSVKGGAAMLGLNSIQRTAHRLEDYFKILKECPIKVDQKLESLFLRVFDTLQGLLEHLQGPFGLTEEAAKNLMSEVEPVFGEMHQHLTLLVEQSGGTLPTEESGAPPLPVQAETPPVETITDKLSEFQPQVLQHLRQMLQLFKQGETSEVQQQLQECCQELIRLGQQLSLPHWCALCEAAASAIANQENTYRTLAPVLIKEVKQAQELVLKDQEAEITIGEQLQALLPLKRAGEVGEEDEEILFFEEAVVAEFEPIPIHREEKPDTSLLVEQFTDESHTSLLGAEVLPPSAYPNGPLVGMAELNSLADLFEGESPDLDETWQQEEILDNFANKLEPEEKIDWLETDGNSDIADFLFDEDSLSQKAVTPVDAEDLASLFGDNFLEEEQVELPDLVLDSDSLIANDEELALVDNLGLIDHPTPEAVAPVNELGLETPIEVPIEDVDDWLLAEIEPPNLLTTEIDPEITSIPDSDIIGFDLNEEILGEQATPLPIPSAQKPEEDFLDLSAKGETLELDSLFGEEEEASSFLIAEEPDFGDLFSTTEETVDGLELLEALHNTTSTSKSPDLSCFWDEESVDTPAKEKIDPVEQELNAELEENWLVASQDIFAGFEEPTPLFTPQFEDFDFDLADSSSPLPLDTTPEASPSIEEFVFLDASETLFQELEREEIFAPPTPEPASTSSYPLPPNAAEQGADVLDFALDMEDADFLSHLGESDESLNVFGQIPEPTLEVGEILELDEIELLVADSHVIEEPELATSSHLEAPLPSLPESAIEEPLFSWDNPDVAEAEASDFDENLAALFNLDIINEPDMPLDQREATVEMEVLPASQESQGEQRATEEVPESTETAIELVSMESQLVLDNEQLTTAEFDELAELLAEEAPATSASAAIISHEFDELEMLLAEDAPAAPPSKKAPTTPSAVPTQAANDAFDELDQLLQEADKTLNTSTPMKLNQGQVTNINRRRRPGLEQTMRVPVKHLDNLSNLVGELVVNRNSLEQDQERLRQFLDNLLHQIQQLSDVGSRMQELYERSLLESSLLASRKGFRPFDRSRDSATSDRHATGVEFDALEIDQFTKFHSLSQEMIELIVRVRESASDIEFVTDETEQVARQFRQVTTQLQEGLTRSRMVPFAQIAERLPRAVREIAIGYGKQAELHIEGKETLIDKVILEQLYDPMTHLVNNAITHGIELPEERVRAGKPPTGRITVRAFHQGNQTVISVTDDGAGINVDKVKAKAVQKGLVTTREAKSMSRLDVYDLLFHPGFTTKDQADDFCGRGVGMDVVRTCLSEIRGVINTDSTPGKGTTFTIRLPLTLSICKALCCLSDKARIAFPMDGVEDMMDIPAQSIQVHAEDGQSYIPWRDSLLPFKPLKELLVHHRQLSRGSVYGGNREDDMISIVILRSTSTYIAIQVDQVLGEQEIVIKQFEGPVPKPLGVAGATVLGDGRIMPIADVLELIDIFHGHIRSDSTGNWWEQSATSVPPEAPPAVKTEPTVLIVDDSITVRELLSMTFNKAGYRVEQARDGQEAWDKLRDGLPCDIVFCDIEMPRMDGLELLSRIQKDSNFNHLPIAMLTSRGADRHRQMAVQLGASGYFTKPYLEEALLDAAQRMLKGEVLVTSSSGT